MEGVKVKMGRGWVGVCRWENIKVGKVVSGKSVE